MANRHLLRSTSMQLLYEIEAANLWEKENVWERLNVSLDRFASEIEDTSYVKEVVSGVMAHKNHIDQKISEFAETWTVETIAPVERNILRVAIFEIVVYQDDDIPYKVSINEAIELGKRFSGPPAGKFINGVLGGLIKSLDEESLSQDVEIKKESIEENLESPEELDNTPEV